MCTFCAVLFRSAFFLTFCAFWSDNKHENLFHFFFFLKLEHEMYVLMAQLRKGALRPDYYYYYYYNYMWSDLITICEYIPKTQRKCTHRQSLKKGTDLILRHATVPHHSHHFALVAGLRPRLMDNLSRALVSWRHRSRVILRSFPWLEHPEVECVWNLSTQLGARVGWCWRRCGLLRCRRCWYWWWGNWVIIIIQDRPLLFSFCWWGCWWRHFACWREREGERDI